MKAGWISELNTDPIKTLKQRNDKHLDYYVKRDLIETDITHVSDLWELPEVVNIINKQQEDGSWKYPGKETTSVPGQDYSLLETFRNLRVLVEVYGFSREHRAMKDAAEYVFSCQTGEGDIRGILGNQYMPYYHGAILELLIKAGYGDDPCVIRGLDWLLTMQQEDGGWIVPTQVVPSKDRTPQYWQSDPLPPDRAKPHAHLATGMVLRAFAVHPEYKSRPEIIEAGSVLKSRILKADKYSDRKAKSYWVKFQYPFWWTSLVSCLDSLARIGFQGQDQDISRGLDWFILHQEEDGLWPTGYGSGRKAAQNRHWVGLAICRVLKHFFQDQEH
jgi:hypothetical protein